MAGVSRRDVLMVGAGGLLAVGAGAVAVALSATRQATPRSRSRGEATAELFGGSLDDARSLGAVYLAEVPDDQIISTGGAVPTGAFPAGVGDPGEWFVAAGPDALAEQAALGCREDFVTDRTVELRGWILPSTAAQLCGIASKET